MDGAVSTMGEAREGLWDRGLAWRRCDWIQRICESEPPPSRREDAAIHLPRLRRWRTFLLSSTCVAGGGGLLAKQARRRGMAWSVGCVIGVLEYGTSEGCHRAVNPTRPLRLGAARRSISPASRGQMAPVGVALLNDVDRPAALTSASCSCPGFRSVAGLLSDPASRPANAARV